MSWLGVTAYTDFGMSDKNMNKLQRVQNRVARIVCGAVESGSRHLKLGTVFCEKQNYKTSRTLCLETATLGLN